MMPPRDSVTNNYLDIEAQPFINEQEVINLHEIYYERQQSMNNPAPHRRHSAGSRTTSIIEGIAISQEPTVLPCERDGFVTWVKCCFSVIYFVWLAYTFCVLIETSCALGLMYLFMWGTLYPVILMVILLFEE